jgi:hypothetical protein
MMFPAAYRCQAGGIVSVLRVILSPKHNRILCRFWFSSLFLEREPGKVEQSYFI